MRCLFEEETISPVEGFQKRKGAILKSSLCSLPGRVVEKIVEIQDLLHFHLQAGFPLLQLCKGGDSPMAQRQSTSLPV